jgi:phage baseplate assembly protein W
MPIVLQNIYPDDVNTLQSKHGTEARALSFSLPLSGRAVFNEVYTTPEVIQANLVNWLLTNKGERVMNPNFGANLREILFEGLNDTTTAALETRIKDNVGLEFPEVIVQRIEFNNDEDRNIVKFTLHYKIRKFETQDSLIIEIR